MYGFRGNRIADLGVAGGVLGFLMGLFALVAGGIGAILQIHGAFGFFLSSWAALFISVVGLFGAWLTRADALPGGVVMAVAGAVGIYVVGGFFIIPSALLLIAGIIAVLESFRQWTVSPY